MLRTLLTLSVLTAVAVSNTAVHAAIPKTGVPEYDQAVARGVAFLREGAVGKSPPSGGDRKCPKPYSS